MTAATLEALEGLPPIPCMALVPWPRASEPDANGFRSVRRCVLPNGHGALDVPCRYELFDERVDVPDIDQSEAF